MKPDLQNNLKNFNTQQLKEINDFLNSANGKNLASKISDMDKEKLMKEFSAINPEEIKKKSAGINAAEIINILKKL